MNKNLSNETAKIIKDELNGNYDYHSSISGRYGRKVPTVENNDKLKELNKIN